MSKNTYAVSPEWDGQRLDRFLVSVIHDQSRSYSQQLVEKGAVLVNGSPAKSSRVLRPGDMVEVCIEPTSLYPTPEAIPLDIVFEDEYILVVNKPAGMSVHPVQLEGGGTLVHALMAHVPTITQAVHDQSSTLSRLRPGIVHRLDKDTSGLLVIAKTEPALHALVEQFKSRSVEKVYLALVEGRLEEEATVHTLLKRHDSGGENRMGISDDEEGREAITHLKPEVRYTLPNGREATLVSCRIETGRTHQIRVHCKHIGNPLLGDQLYSTKSSRESSSRVGAQRQILHATKLTFNHPVSGERLSFEAALAPDMQEVLTKLLPV